jgi:hypothetical protein
MKKINLLIISILLSFQLVLAQNPLLGTWITEIENRKEVMVMKDKEFIVTTTSTSEPTTIDTFQIVKFFPMVQDTGKYIIEMKTEYQPEYFIHYYFSVSKDQFKLFRGHSTFFYLEDALNYAKKSVKVYSYERYMSKAYYEEYNKRPTMPSPDKKVILSALNMTLNQVKIAKKAGKPVDVSQIMNDWAEKQGFHAARSEKVFQEALEKLENDPEIKAKVSELTSLER